MMDTEQLVQEIVKRSDRTQSTDLSTLSQKDLNELNSLAASLTGLTNVHSSSSMVMKTFLTYGVVCSVCTVVGLVAGVNHLVLLLGNLLAAGGVAAWMTYTLYLYSEAIRLVLTEYDKVIDRAAKKESE